MGSAGCIRAKTGTRDVWQRLHIILSSGDRHRQPHNAPRLGHGKTTEPLDPRDHPDDRHKHASLCNRQRYVGIHLLRLHLHPLPSHRHLRIRCYPKHECSHYNSSLRDLCSHTDGLSHDLYRSEDCHQVKGPHHMGAKHPSEPVLRNRLPRGLSRHNILSRGLNDLLASPPNLGLPPLPPRHANQPLPPRPYNTDSAIQRPHIRHHPLPHRLEDIRVGREEIQARRNSRLVLSSQTKIQ